MEYIEINFDNIGEMIEQYGIDVCRFFEKEQLCDDKLRELTASASVTEGTLDRVKYELRRAEAMRNIAEGFVLALLLQKINSKIFND